MGKKKNFINLSGKRYDSMLGRCYRESDPSYKNYGLKGVKVCGEWLRDIESFRMWLLKELNRIEITVEDFVSKSGDYHLDRIDGNGHYTPNNCRLTSKQINARNKKNTKYKTLISAEGETIRFNELTIVKEKT